MIICHSERLVLSRVEGSEESALTYFIARSSGYVNLDTYPSLPSPKGEGNLLPLLGGEGRGEVSCRYEAESRKLKESHK